MTQTSSPWDGISIGDAVDAPYSAAEWCAKWAKLSGAFKTRFPNYGVLAGTGDGTYDPLQPIASGGSNVDVKIGVALVNGTLYETDAAVTVTVAANAAGNPRIDTVVLRVDYTAQTCRVVLKQGTAAASPARPSLTQNTSLWEMPIADIAVANGFSSIVQRDVSDRRRFMHSAQDGWLPYAYPVCTTPADPHADSYSWNAGYALAVPVHLAGNMLLDQLNLLTFSNVNSVVDWGVFVEDLNDSANTNLTVRRIGGRDVVGLGTTTAFSSGSMVAVPATPVLPLPPGMYWLIMKTSQNVSLGAKNPTASRFNAGTPNFFLNTTGAALPATQTINLMAGGWAQDTGGASLAVRLEGRVLDQSTAF